MRIGLISEENCDFAQRLARAIAPRIESLQLPIRDAVATYPAALAERDPCQVLSVVGAEVDHWDINRSRPYECDFGVWRSGYDGVVPMQVTLEPQLFDMATETRERRERDGVELFVDETYCSAATSSTPATWSSGRRWWSTAGEGSARWPPMWPRPRPSSTAEVFCSSRKRSSPVFCSSRKRSSHSHV